MKTPPFSWTRSALALCAALALTACGGGGDDGNDAGGNTPPPAGGGGGTPPPAGGGSTAAPLVISNATPSTLNGTLDKSVALFESGSSNETMGTFNATDSHCRVAAYVMPLPGSSDTYFVELSFRKTDGAIGLVNFGTDAGLAVLARVAAPTTGVTVDVANRRIVFTAFTLSSSNTTVTLDGSLEYPTNIAPENRAACG